MNDILDILKKADNIQQELEETEVKLQRAMLESLNNIRLLVQASRNLGMSDDEIKAMTPDLMKLPEKTIAFLFGE